MPVAHSVVVVGVTVNQIDIALRLRHCDGGGQVIEVFVA